MPPMYTPGQRVTSSEFGKGVVRGTSAGGMLRVYFDATESVEFVSADSVRAMGSDAPPPTKMRAEPAPAPKQLTVDKRRLAVECLRQGLPPPEMLASWTFGHAKARKKMDAAIANAAKGSGSVLMVRAAYGQGKSHLGRLGCELAREQGFLTMNVELDGDGLSLRYGTRVIASLFASARMPAVGDAETEHLVPGLAPLLRRAATVKRLPKRLEIFKPFLEEPEWWVESEPAIETLEAYLSGDLNAPTASGRLQEFLGKRFRLQSLRMAYGTAEDRQHAQAEQLLRVTELAVQAGAKGAFVVIDELDHDLRNDRDSRVSEMLEQLAAVAKKGPVVVLLLARDGTNHDAHFEIDDAEELVLDGLADKEIALLVDKAIDTYGAAFPLPALHSGREEFLGVLRDQFDSEYERSGWGPRFFVRATIEACEAVRTRGLRSLASVKF